MQIPLQLRIVTDKAAPTSQPLERAGGDAITPEFSDVDKLRPTGVRYHGFAGSYEVVDYVRVRDANDRQPLTATTVSTDADHSSVSESLEQYLNDREMSKTPLSLSDETFIPKPYRFDSADNVPDDTQSETPAGHEHASSERPRPPPVHERPEHGKQSELPPRHHGCLRGPPQLHHHARHVSCGCHVPPPPRHDHHGPHGGLPGSHDRERFPHHPPPPPPCKYGRQGAWPHDGYHEPAHIPNDRPPRHGGDEHRRPPPPFEDGSHSSHGPHGPSRGGMLPQQSHERCRHEHFDRPPFGMPRRDSGMSGPHHCDGSPRGPPGMRGEPWHHAAPPPPFFHGPPPPPPRCLHRFHGFPHMPCSPHHGPPFGGFPFFDKPGSRHGMRHDHSRSDWDAPRWPRPVMA